MELKINKITFTLKNLNAERRLFFIKNILTPHAKINSKDITKEEKPKLIAKQAQSIIDLVWMFLPAQDKKELKDKSLMKIEAEDFAYFLKTLDEKLKSYSDFVKNEGDNEKGVITEISEVYAFLSKEFGWTFDYIKEMEEIELLKAVKQAIKIKKDRQRSVLNNNVLAGAVVAGNKKAHKTYSDINKKADRERLMQQMQAQPATRSTPFLSDEELRRAVNDGRS
jgi:glycine cleavage system H lipoate-binding protein